MPRGRRKDPEGAASNAAQQPVREGKVAPRIVRADILQRTKMIGCGVVKELYTEFRIQLYRHDLSASESIAEFASLVAKQDPIALGILERLAQRKVKEKLAKERSKEKARQSQADSKRARVSLEEVDHDALYGLIEQARSEGQ